MSAHKRKIEWDDMFRQDAQEEIDMCLECTKPECTNCIAYAHNPRPYHEWTEIDIEILKKTELTRKQKAEIIGVTMNALGQKIRGLGLSVQNKGERKKWTEEEIDFLFSHTNEETSEKFGRTINACQLKRMIENAK